MYLPVIPEIDFHRMIGAIEPPRLPFDFGFQETRSQIPDNFRTIAPLRVSTPAAYSPYSRNGSGTRPVTQEAHLGPSSCGRVAERGTFACTSRKTALAGIPAICLPSTVAASSGGGRQSSSSNALASVPLARMGISG